MLVSPLEVVRRNSKADQHVRPFSSPRTLLSDEPKKRTWGTLKGSWVPHDIRDQVVDFVHRWSERTEIALCVLVLWLGISLSKFYFYSITFAKSPTTGCMTALLATTTFSGKNQKVML